MDNNKKKNKISPHKGFSLSNPFKGISSSFMSDSNNIGALFVGAFLSLVEGVVTLVLLWPFWLMDLAYKLLCWVGADKLLYKITSVIAKTRLGKKVLGMDVDKENPEKLLAWLEEKGRSFDSFETDFDRIDEYRKEAYPPHKHKHMHIPTPANLERGVYYYDRLPCGKSKNFALESFYANPTLLADAYKKTAGRSMLLGLLLITPIVLILFHMFGGLIGIDYSSAESWGYYGEYSTISPLSLIGTSILSVIALAICMIPFIYIPRVAKSQHDILAREEMIQEIRNQLRVSGGLEASKMSETEYENNIGEYPVFTVSRMDQLLEYKRVYEAGEAMVEVHHDDGTARTRGAQFAYEKGTKMLMCVSEMCMNSYGSGMIGTGKTRTLLKPNFRATIRAFKKAGLPLQGMGLDGKADLHHDLKKILVEEGMSTDKFLMLGVKEGQYGLDVFGDAPVDLIMSRIMATAKGEPDPHFDVLAIALMRNILTIARAADQMEIGVKYYEETGGCTMSSPAFVKDCANSEDMLFGLITEMLEEFERDPELRKALYDTSLRSAIDGIVLDWRNSLKAEEMAMGIVSCVSKYLGPFLNNGLIRERFGEGRKGSDIVDMSYAFDGYFIFPDIPDSVYGETARVINSFARSDLFERATTRQVEYSAIGKDPMSEPVMIIIDEHGAMCSSGVSTSSDQGALNQSRSKGIVFNSYTQSRESFEMIIGKAQTDNMTQQMVSRYWLPMNSEADARWLQSSMGHYMKINTSVDGVYPTEGAREAVNGGVITNPSQGITVLSKSSKIGLPTGIAHSDKSEVIYKHGRSTEKWFFELAGYSNKLFEFKASTDYISNIAATGAIKNQLNYGLTFMQGSRFGDFYGKPHAEGNDLVAAMQKKLGINQESQKEIQELEKTERNQGIEKASLFTADDFFDGGRFHALASIPQFGITHRCRIELGYKGEEYSL